MLINQHEATSSLYLNSTQPPEKENLPSRGTDCLTGSFCIQKGVQLKRSVTGVVLQA